MLNGSVVVRRGEGSEENLSAGFGYFRDSGGKVLRMEIRKEVFIINFFYYLLLKLYHLISSSPHFLFIINQKYSKRLNEFPLNLSLI